MTDPTDPAATNPATMTDDDLRQAEKECLAIANEIGEEDEVDETAFCFYLDAVNTIRKEMKRRG